MGQELFADQVLDEDPVQPGLLDTRRALREELPISPVLLLHQTERQYFTERTSHLFGVKAAPPLPGSPEWISENTSPQPPFTAPKSCTSKT